MIFFSLNEPYKYYITDIILIYDKMVYIAWHTGRLFNLGKDRKGGNNSFGYNRLNTPFTVSSRYP